MKSISPEIVELYSQLAEHTFSDCKSHCKTISSCCEAEFCEKTRVFAEEHGVKLETTGHPTLPYMSPTGCIVPPHLRPVCTEFVCCIREHRKKPGDERWTAKYYDIRKKIFLLQLADKRSK